jgi:hypothetical protein
MKQVPYHDNPGNACALACYTMTAQYLLPDQNITFEQLGKIADWEKGYTVWGFTVWNFLMDKGVHITDYDTINYQKWARNGFGSLKDSLPSVEFNTYKNGTYDVDTVGKQIELALNHPNFTYIQRKPTWKDVVTEFNKPGICELTINANALNNLNGFSSHRIVLIDITDKEVIFHDPNRTGTGAYRHDPLNHFKNMYENVDEPELAHYSL